MSDQEKQEKQEQPTVQLGFGQAMTEMYGVDWRDTVSEGDVNRARHFYHKGLNDTQIAIQVANVQLSQSVHNLYSTLTAGAEKRIAEQQAAAEAEAAKAAPKAKKAAKPAAKPAAKKPVKKAVAKGRK